MQPTLKSKAALALLCLWCLVVLAVRMRYAGSMHYGFMVWNLFLAVIPVVAAGLARARVSRRGGSVLTAALFLAWLAFLPNAPYLVTDLIHLEALPPVPLWYDIVLLGSFAATGVLLGYISVSDIEALVSERFGRVLGAVVAYGALAISGFGIYLGRFLRWNSWDLVTSPTSLLAQIAHRFAEPAAHQRTWAVTVLYGAALMLGYLALRATASSLAATEPVRYQERATVARTRGSRGSRRRV